MVMRNHAAGVWRDLVCVSMPGSDRRVHSEVGIYKRKQESKKKTRKHALDQKSDQEKKKENTLSTKKILSKKRNQEKEGRK